MIHYLPKCTQIQVNKNILYMENINKVVISERSKLFNIIMSTGKVPIITKTGYILNETN